MLEIGRRKRAQPPPPPVVFEALTNPYRDSTRPWLDLLDEVRRVILEQNPPSLMVWSSLWIKRPDAKIRFDLSGGGSGADLCRTLHVEEPPPTEALFGHMCKRINQFINANFDTPSDSRRIMPSCRAHGARETSGIAADRARSRRVEGACSGRI